jgi:hypothetical protein
VWALAFKGKVSVGTGLPGEIHRVQSVNTGERIHATPDAHVRSLYADPQGRIWAGTSGSGLILRIDKTGHATTVYDSGKPEVTAIVADKGGRVWAAVGTAEMTVAASEPSSAQQEAPAPEGTKSATPTDDDDDNKRCRSACPRSASRAARRRKRQLLRGTVLFDRASPADVWTSNDEVVFDLARDDDGAGSGPTGPRGKLCRSRRTPRP